MKTTRIILPLLAAIAGSVLPARNLQAAKAGDLDTSFNANVDGAVDGVAVQGDGKIVIVGAFTTVNGVAHPHVARLNADGSLDTAFTATADAGVSALLIQASGQIVLGGKFATVNGVARKRLARVNADGSLDTAYASADTHVEGDLYELAAQSTGKIVALEIYVEPTQYGTGIVNKIERFNLDGSYDSTFKAANLSIPNNTALSVQLNDRIFYVGPSGTAQNSETHRLYADGGTDPEFVSVKGTTYTAPSASVVLPDQRIIVSGPFQDATNTEILRLNLSYGSADPSFQAVTSTGKIYRIARQADGQLVVGGNFTQIDGSARANLARVSVDGVLDTGFVPTAAMDGYIDTLASQADGKVIVGGTFSHVGGVLHQGIARYYGADTAVPQITSAASATEQVNASFSYQIAATGTVTGFAAGTVYGVDVSVSKPLPAGLSLNAATGLISGVPTREGNYVIAVKASNRAGTDLKEITLNIATAAGQTHPAFFTGEEPLSNGVYYLKFFYSGIQPTNDFSYYAYLADPHYLYHFDLGYEYVFDAADGKAGVYFYDFASSTFFYTSPAFPFPYLYDFSLNATLYYYPAPNNPGHYNTNGVRYFYNFATGKIISK